MNKKKKLYTNVLNAMRRLATEIDTEAHGMGWAGYPCPYLRIDVYPDCDQPKGRRTGGRPCHS